MNACFQRSLPVHSIKMGVDRSVQFSFPLYSVLLPIVALLFIGSFSVANAQTEDSIPIYNTDSLQIRYGMKLYASVEELRDSVFPALKTRKFEPLTAFILNAPILQDQFDTMDLGYLQRLATIKAEYVSANLRKQHRILLKEAKANGYNLRLMTLADSRVRFSSHNGIAVADVTYYCRYNKHRFYISFLAIQVMGHWFLSDQLRIRQS